MALGDQNQNVAAGPGTKGYTYVNGVLTSVGGVPTGNAPAPTPAPAPVSNPTPVISNTQITKTNSNPQPAPQPVPQPVVYNNPQPTPVYNTPAPTPAPAPLVPPPNDHLVTPNTGNTAVTTTSNAAPTVALQPGSTDSSSVMQLQRYLVANGYMTQAQMDTGPGTYGPQTTAAVAALQKKLGVDNTTGVGYYGPKTQAAIAAAATPPAITPVGNPVDGSAVGKNPTAPALPDGTAGTALATVNTSIATTVANAQAQLDAALAQQKAATQAQIDALTAKSDSLQSLQELGMASEQSVIAKETADKQAALALEQQQYTDNYNASQALVGELDGLLTQGNAVVADMKNTTGLSSIMTPRISQTMTDIAARAGVIQAVLSARNNQIGLAQSQLSSSLSAITSIANDQINYYQNIVSFYNKQQGDVQAQINTLSSNEKTYITAQINVLQDKLTQAQATATQISHALLDPNSALLYAKAGVTLTDTSAQVNAKLAVASYSQELSDTANKMAAAGYTTHPIPGVVPVTTTDSAGATKSWYKDTVAVSAGGTVGAGGGNGGGSVKLPTGSPINATSNDISQGEQILNNSKTAPNAQGVAGDGKYSDPTIYLQMYKAWLTAGGTAKSFQAAYPYTKYINPANTWLLGDMQTASGGSGGAQTP